MLLRVIFFKVLPIMEYIEITPVLIIIITYKGKTSFASFIALN